MRRTDEAFKAEVLRRSRAYRARRAKQRKQLLAVACCLALAVGLFLLNPSMGTDAVLFDEKNAESAMAPEAASPQDAPMEEYGGMNGAPETPEAEAPASIPMLLQISDQQQATLSQEDILFLYDLLERVQWKDTLSNCAPDYQLRLGGQEFAYHTACGTIQDYASNRSTTLTEEEQIRLNSLIAGYFPKA